MKKDKNIIAYWSRTAETENNFGDALNATVIPWVSGGNISHSGSPWKPRNPFSSIVCGIGSILESAKFIERPSGLKVIVWGTGTKGFMRHAKHLRHATFLSVRGPKTRDLLHSHGISDVPEIYGDPAMLVPEMWPDLKNSAKGKPVIIPHYKDRDLAIKLLESNKKISGNFQLLDVLDPPENVIKNIAQSSAVLSSSLHGLIIADAFRIPSRWLNFGNDVGGGEFKFQDHFLAVWGEERTCSSALKCSDLSRALDSVETSPRFDTFNLKKSLNVI